MSDRNNAASDLRAAAAKYYDFPQISMSTTSNLSGEFTRRAPGCIPGYVGLTCHCFGLAVEDRTSWATDRAALRLTFHLHKRNMLLTMKAAFPKEPIPEIKAVDGNCVK